MSSIEPDSSRKQQRFLRSETCVGVDSTELQRKYGDSPQPPENALPVSADPVVDLPPAAAPEVPTPVKLEPEIEAAKPDWILYEECKRTIRAGLHTFYEVGEALIKIRDRKLYRLGGHPTFEACVRAEFDISRPRAYQLIEAAATVQECLPLVDKTLNERQARALSGLEPQEKREVLAEALTTTGAVSSPPSTSRTHGPSAAPCPLPKKSRHRRNRSPSHRR
jgi:hypothetical protein